MKHQHIRRLALLMALIVLASFGCGTGGGNGRDPHTQAERQPDNRRPAENAGLL